MRSGSRSCKYFKALKGIDFSPRRISWTRLSDLQTFPIIQSLPRENDNPPIVSSWQSSMKLQILQEELPLQDAGFREQKSSNLFCPIFALWCWNSKLNSAKAVMRLLITLEEENFPSFKSLAASTTGLLSTKQTVFLELALMLALIIGDLIPTYTAIISPSHGSVFGLICESFNMFSIDFSNLVLNLETTFGLFSTIAHNVQLIPFSDQSEVITNWSLCFGRYNLSNFNISSFDLKNFDSNSFVQTSLSQDFFPAWNSSRSFRRNDISFLHLKKVLKAPR